jgi:acetoacetyl-CoA synthetase
VEGSQLTSFIRFCEDETGRALPIKRRSTTSRWRITDSSGVFVRWSGLVSTGSPEPVCTDDDCERALLPELVSATSRISSAAVRSDGEQLAPARHHAAPTERLTRRELADRVAALSSAMSALGVRPGDRVVAIAGNTAETVVAGLATVANGATFSAGSPDMGALAILSRFRQLNPSILFAVLGGNEQSPLPLAERVADVVQGLPP